MFLADSSLIGVFCLSNVEHAEALVEFLTGVWLFLLLIMPDYFSAAIYWTISAG